MNASILNSLNRRTKMPMRFNGIMTGENNDFMIMVFKQLFSWGSVIIVYLLIIKS